MDGRRVGIKPRPSGETDVDPVVGMLNRGCGPRVMQISSRDRGGAHGVPSKVARTAPVTTRRRTCLRGSLRRLMSGPS